ncbi:unnamed protein product, partial [Auanema sp. JU1783]
MKSLVFFSLLYTNCFCSFLEYNSEYARNYFDYAAAVYSKDVMQCLSNTVSTTNLLMLHHEEFVCMSDKSNCKVLAVSSVQDKIIHISVKGPNEIDKIDKDFLRKIRGTVEFLDFGLIDHHFSTAHQCTWKIIKNILKSENTSGYDIVFSGHSTGGALATLAALQAYRIGVPSYLIHLYTYGEPRIGNILFANNVDRLFADSWRIVNARDVVPHLASCRDDDMDIKFGKDCAESS